MAHPVEIEPSLYQDVAASATGTALGTIGIGARLDGVMVYPETVGAGTIALLDGSTSVNIFVTGTLPSLVPFFIPNCSARSRNGPWKITTGANVHVRAFGNF